MRFVRIFALLFCGVLACSDDGSGVATDSGYADMRDLGAVDEGSGADATADMVPDVSDMAPDVSDLASDAEISPEDMGRDTGMDSGDGVGPDGPKPTCDDTWPPNRINDPMALLPSTHSISLAASELTVQLGVAGRFSGIGTSLRIRNGVGALSDNMIEARSGAGAANQFTMFGDLAGDTLVANQAAGNSAGHQWGYEACLWERENGTVLDGQRWLPMETDEYRPGGVGGMSVATSPLLSGANKSRQALSGRPVWKLVDVEVPGAGSIIEVRKTWVVRNTSAAPVTLTNEISWDALYHRPQFSLDYDMRMIYAWKHAGGNMTYDAITPHAPMGTGPNGEAIPNRFVSAPAGTTQYEYIPFVKGKWAMHTFPSGAGYLDHIVYAFELDGEEVGVAMTPPVQGRTTIGFVGKTYADQPGEHAGTIHLYSIFEEGQNLTMAPGEERSYTIRYFVGTLTQLAAAGFGTGGAAPVAGCSGCLGAWASCVDACYQVASVPGHCAVPGSTDTNSCCACY